MKQSILAFSALLFVTPPVFAQPLPTPHTYTIKPGYGPDPGSILNPYIFRDENGTQLGELYREPYGSSYEDPNFGRQWDFRFDEPQGQSGWERGDE